MSSKFKFSALSMICALSVTLTGCEKPDESADSASGNTSAQSGSASGASETAEAPANDADKIADIAVTVPESADCVIKFASDGITADGGAKVSGSVVTISRSGVYELSGESADCKIKIEADKDAEITLLMNGVDLASKDGSVIDCQKADKLIFYLSDGTVNSLCDSETYSAQGEDDPDAAVFTRSDLIICGGGELKVTGQYSDAVKCKDSAAVTDGKLTLTAADDALTGKDSVLISGGELFIKAGGDGIKSTNETDEGRGYIGVSGGKITVESERDGIQAKNDMNISGGTINIVSGGSAADEPVHSSSEPWDHDPRGNAGNSDSSEETTVSQKGIKAGGSITVGGGELSVKSADDSVHSGKDIKITGGTLSLSSCDDGIHSDEALVVENGSITVEKSYEGLEGKSISIENGVISITAEDDGLNAAGGDNGEAFGFGQADDGYFINIAGGDITVNANGDGIDSNGTVAQSGGSVTVYGPTSSMNGAVDYEMSYAMSGGTLIALGAVGMAQTPSTLSQPCFSLNNTAEAGSVIEVRGKSGVILSATTPKLAQSLIFSSDKFKEGEEYSIYINDELIKTYTAENGVVGDSVGGGFGGGFGGPGGFGGGHHGGFGENFSGGDFSGGDFSGDFGGQKPPDFPNGGERPERPDDIGQIERTA